MSALVRCRVHGCRLTAKEHVIQPMPWPGDRLYDRMVIASVWYDDEPGRETATLLLLAPDSLRDRDFANRYNFEVAQLDLGPHGNLTILSTHMNIVPAVREYEDNGGDY